MIARAAEQTVRQASSSLEARRRLVAQSLQVGNPGNDARNLPDEADPRVECQTELRVMEIRPYEHNPRRAGNSKFADIKESIRNGGLRTPLTVTRRPGEKHFIVESGGNTRLVALQQLWTETGEARFAKLSVLFRPWRSESHVLLAHMVENEQRGEMSFWDKANAIVGLKARLEAERGTVLSLREFDQALKSMGLGTNHTSLGHYLFAIQHLRPLGEAIPGLSAQDVKTVQPRLNALRRVAERAGVESDRFYLAMVEPALRGAVERHRQGFAFSARQLCIACERLVAQHVGAVSQAISAGSGHLWARSTSEGGRRRHVNDVDIERIGLSPLRGATPSLPPEGSSSVSRSPITALAFDLARRASIAERFHDDSVAPLGFRVDAPIAAEGLCTGARWIVWMLWTVSSHKANADFAALFDPVDLGSDGPVGEGQNRSAPTVVMSADFLLKWLTDPQDDLADAALTFLGEMRRGRVDRDAKSTAVAKPARTGGDDASVA